MAHKGKIVSADGRHTVFVVLWKDPSDENSTVMGVFASLRSAEETLHALTKEEPGYGQVVEEFLKG